MLVSYWWRGFSNSRWTPHCYWQAAKLLKASVVKPLLATLEQSLIVKQLCTLSSRDQAALKESLALILQA